MKSGERGTQVICKNKKFLNRLQIEEAMIVGNISMFAMVTMVTIVIAVLVVGVIIIYGSSENGTMNRVVSILYRQCARWAVAAEQDKSDMIAVLHANYAAGYLWAIKDIVDTNNFKQITGQDFLEFEKKIVKIQDNATYRLVSKCRSVVPINDKDLIQAIYGKI